MDREVWQAIQFVGSQRVGHDWATNTHPHPQRRFTFTENWVPLKTGSRNSSLLPFWGTLYNSLANADVLTKAYGLIDFLSFPLLQIFSLFTGARLNLRDKVIKKKYIYIYFLHEVKNFLLLCQERRGHRRLMPSKLSCLEGVVSSLTGSKSYSSLTRRRVWSARGHCSDWVKADIINLLVSTGLGSVKTGHETRLVPNWERSMSRRHIVTLLIIWLTCRVHHEKCQAEWSISWNQDCREKYQ